MGAHHALRRHADHQFALLLNSINAKRYKKIVQTITYIPHFISIVMLVGMLMQLFNPNVGMYGVIYKSLTGTKPADPFAIPEAFFYMYIGSGIWKSFGWGSIFYLAALTSIDTELFNVAKIDGAGPLQRVWYITLPGILPVVVFVLTMSLGKLLSAANTEQILLFYGPQNYSVSDVIGTWVYRQGLGKVQYSLGAAVSLFQSAIGLVLVLVCNKVAGKTAGVGIW